MTNWNDRITQAKKAEQSVLDRLSANGWNAEFFGQAQLSQNCRFYLKNHKGENGMPALIRWMPDLIAYSHLGVALIDAKTGRKDTSNHAIETIAIETAGIYGYWLNTPTYFVFDENMTVLTPDEAWNLGVEGSQSSNGSGTPYLLVKKTSAHAFDDVFPVIKRTLEHN